MLISPDSVCDGIEVIIKNRNVCIKLGIADLVLISNATVIPVFTSLDCDGKIKCDFLKALNPGINSIIYQEKRLALITQYAEILETKWTEEPGNILNKRMEAFINLPVYE